MKHSTYAALAALAIIASACSGNKEEENQNTDAAAVETELPRVELGVASRRDVDQTKSYTATVEADNTNNISPSTPNRIKTITVDVGDKVARGQTVATLDRSNIDQVKIQLDNATREYNRAKQLLEIGSGTQMQVDAYKTQVDGLRTQYNNLMENTVLVSPISGVVTARNYDPGDMTGNLPVVTVGQIQPNVKVMVSISENDYEAIKRNMPVTVTFDAFPDEEFRGHVSRIYPTVDPATRTFQTEILISNASGKIMPGMFARVDVNLGSQSHIVVPDRAVVKQTGSGNKYVYVYRNGAVEYIQVETGQRLGDAYELISGLADGDSVVITGQNALHDGAKVKPVYRK